MGDIYECPQPVRTGPAPLPPRTAPPMSRYGPTTNAPKRDAKPTASASARLDPTVSDDYECPAAVIIRPPPLPSAPAPPRVAASPRPSRQPNYNHTAGVPRRHGNSSSNKTSYRTSFLVFTLLMVLSVSLQVSAFILSMSAGSDAEELRAQQKKYQQKTEGRFKSLEAQLAKQNKALSEIEKHIGTGPDTAATPAEDQEASNTAVKAGKQTKDEHKSLIKDTEKHTTTGTSGIVHVGKGESFPKDCSDWYMLGIRENGTRQIRPEQAQSKVDVYCEMGSDGGWTVIHARETHVYLVDRLWEDYKLGFNEGDWTTFWLGNDLIHQITAQGTYELKVVGRKTGRGTTVAARYTTFLVENEEDNYRLKLGTFTDGDVENALQLNNGQEFITTDRPNTECHTSPYGWWASDCQLEERWVRDGHMASPLFQMEELKMMIKPA